MAANASALDVQSLLDCCVKKVMEYLPHFINSVGILPSNLKGRLLYLMCKRGLVTDDNIKQVLHERVSVLDLSESEAGDIALSEVAAKCPRLRKLDLNSCRVNRTTVTDTGVCDLATHCHYLQVVYLRRCSNLTDIGVVALSEHCKGLRELNIGGCEQVSNAALQALSQNCPQLHCVNFSRARVTDDGIFSLASGVCAKSLQEIHMNGCVAQTDEAVEAVVMSCPRISILLFHSCPNITERSRQALEEVLGNNGKMKQVTWTIY